MRTLAVTAKRTLVLAMLVLTTACSQLQSQQGVASAAQNIAEIYPSQRAALVAATNRFNPVSIAEDREFMGAIYRCQEGFRYSVGAGEAGAGNVTVTLVAPAGCQIDALWHTHGGANPRHQYFSGVDTQLVAETGLAFYMADYSGKLRVFEPGDRTMTIAEARRLGLGTASDYGHGKIVRDAQGQHLVVTTSEAGGSDIAMAGARTQLSP